MTHNAWEEWMDSESKETWVAKYSYAIAHRDFLLAATKGHSCHGILRESEIQHHCTISTDEELQFTMWWSFDEDNVGYAGGSLDVVVTFRNDDLLGRLQLETSKFHGFGNTWEQDHEQ